MLDHERLELAVGVNYQSLGNNEDGVLLSMASGFLFRCNGTAVHVLDAVRDRPTFSELRARFAEHFGLHEDQADADLSCFLDQLLAENLIAKAA